MTFFQALSQKNPEDKGKRAHTEEDAAAQPILQTWPEELAAWLKSQFRTLQIYKWSELLETSIARKAKV